MIDVLVAEILEALMLICFGLSWPMNAYKAYQAKTAKGTSWQFLSLICLGYVCGIGAKLALGAISWVLVVYVANLVALAVNWAIYFRNRRIDARSGSVVCFPQAEECIVTASQLALTK